MGQRTLTLHWGVLTFCDSDGEIYKYKAATGNSGSINPFIENVGPIPPGTYTLRPEEIRGGILRFFKWEVIDRADWGMYRAPLHPDEDTRLFGREGFFVHGGIFSGSAGCIDIGTPNDIELFDLLKKSDDTVLVRVTGYPTGNEPVTDFTYA